MAEIGSGNNSSYPGALDVNAVVEVNSPAAGKTKARKEVVEDLSAIAIAIETELGTDPAGTLTDVKTYLQTQHQTDGTHKNTHGPHKWLDEQDYANFTAAVAAAPNKTLVIARSINLDANTTIPASVSLMPINPGIINANGYTLTINAPPVGNPMHQWLSGFAAGEVTGLKTVKAEWFGTIPLAVSVGTDVLLEKSDYTIPSLITTLEGQGIVGGGMSATANKGTRLILSYDGDGIRLPYTFQDLKNFYLDCNNKNGDGINAVCNYAKLERIQIKNCKTGYWALLIESSANAYYDIFIMDCRNGINLTGVGSGSFQSFYNCYVVSDASGLMETAIKLSVSSIVFAVNFYNLFIESGTGKALEINNIAGSVIDGIYLEAPYLSTGDLISFTGSSTTDFSIKNGVISQTHASYAGNFVTSVAGTNISFDNVFFNKVASNSIELLNFNGTVGVSIKNCNLTAPAGSYFMYDSATTEKLIIENLKSSNTTTIVLRGFSHRIEGGSSNVTIDIQSTAHDIVIRNFPGTITIHSSAARIVLINCTGSVTDTGNVSVQLGALQATNADTSGATLGQLETEVNELKALLRNVGLMAT